MQNNLRAACARPQNRRNIFSGLVVFCAVLLLSACQSVQTTNPGVVGITRTQSMLVSSADVDQASVQAYRQMVSSANQKGAISHDAALVNRVRGISKRLIAQVGVFRPDALNWAWEVNVFESKDVNAFCMAGGKIGVYTGLIDAIKPTDDELAAVLGHEIAHALREHVREKISKQKVQQGFLSVGAIAASIFTGTSAAGNAVSQLGPAVMDVSFNLPNSREAESEADRIGLELAARAGYDPHAAVTLWQKMDKLGGSKQPQFLSTHPSNESRIEELQETAKLVAPLGKGGSGVSR